MTNKALYHALAATLTALALGACAPRYDTRLTNLTSYLGTDGSVVRKESAANLADLKSYWDGDGMTGAPTIVINLSEQTASFYKGGKLAGVSAISSGREGFGTPSGHFKIIQKDKDHKSSQFGDFVDAAGQPVVKNVDVTKDKCPPGAHFEGAPMPYFMRITGGVGMHQGFLPGVPDSHGCIRMPERMVKIFWDNTPMGTPVTIIQ